ncbi:roquin-2-like isoform X2 [Stegodyphus dumicola]|uniref:roquin-2-like isoform X2 n=1 Tax=Stegodyphus dumicola TaxID=202533 RepID=UPI0015B0AD94|nr:roquin-2-like isoform X2 [Stegodyphus dumicola]
MQKKLVTLINCQLVEEEGRTRGMRTARSLGERSVTELILQHQNPQQLSANLWAAVRARGCQFLGPAMQEEVLKLILLTLEDGSALSRKVLVRFVVQRLAPHFPQASKTSIGHVVQLLYRASCFKVSKHEGDSSLMQLKEEFCVYEALRREHDAQIVQIATDAGLRIAPEQWSSLLYGDTAHKSHMQSIIDKLQTPQSFLQSVQELVIALQRTGDPGNLSVLRPHLELLAGIDPGPDTPPPSWKDLKNAQEATKIVVKGLVEFLQNFGNRKLHEDRPNLNTKYKTSMCRDLTQRGSCPRGTSCTFAHSQEELDKFRTRNKRSFGSLSSGPSARSVVSDNSTGKPKDNVVSSNSSLSVNVNSHGTSEALISSICGASNDSFVGQFISESFSCAVTDTVVESSSIHFCNSKISGRCSVSDPCTELGIHPSSQTVHILNPDSPAFQPSPTKSSLLPKHSSYQTLTTTTVCSSFSSAVLSAIPTTVTSLPTTKWKLNEMCQSQQLVQNTSSFPTDALALSTSSLSISHIMTTVQSKSSPSTSKPSLNTQRLECQSLAALQQRRKQLLAQLSVTKYANPPSENGVFPPSNTEMMLKAVEDSNAVSFYSPWTSANIFSYGPPSSNCNISSYSSVNPDYDEVISPGSEVEVENNLFEMNYCHSCPLFCPSEKDEFIPFDPPLVSKYGPISRCSKSLIRGPMPIQVNAVSQMGELTSPTSVVRHPLPSASFAPSFYAATSPIPLAIISEQHLPIIDSASVIVPVAVCPPEETDVIRMNDMESFNSAENHIQNNIYELQMNEVEPNMDLLRERLWEIEETIQEKEQAMAKPGMHYTGHSLKQKYNFKTGGTVPTSIGPWPSQTLENFPVKNTEADYENKVGKEINDVGQQWLEVLCLEEDDVWIEENNGTYDFGGNELLSIFNVFPCVW